MNPDRTNYKIWLVDYLDGSLDSLQIEQLISFLEENPDIKEEFNEIAQYNIKPGNNSFRNKDRIKKSITDINESQFDYLCVADLENDLSGKQSAELEEIIAQSPEKRKVYELIHKLRLVAPLVNYESKNKLKKLTTTQKVIRFSFIGLSAAAAIVIMILLFNPLIININDKGAETAINLNPDTNVTNTSPVVFSEKNSQPAEITIKLVSENVISGEQKPITSGTNSFAGESVPYDSSATKMNFQPAVLASIDFKQNIELIEKPLSSTLVAINMDIQYPVINEKPGLNELIVKAFREKILKSDTPATGSIKVYEIADAGISGLNKLFGWQMSLQKNRDEKGELQSVYFSSKILKFNAPVKKSLAAL